MDSMYSPFNPELAVGFDYKCTDSDDKDPINYELSSKGAHEFITSHPPASDAAMRLLTVYQPRHESVSRLPWTEETVDHAIWNPKVYTDLASTTAGGVAALVDEPYRFILQTPADDGPFCSFALSNRGHATKGLYIYSVASLDGQRDDVFEPAELLEGERINSGWRSTGLQIISLPSAFLRKHSLWMGRQLAYVTQRVESIEAALFNSHYPPNLPDLNRLLYSCSTRLVILARRSNLEKHTVAAIECICSASRQGKSPWPPLAPLKNAIEGRDYDFAALPRRIEDARATINTLINQRNQAMNLEIAESSQRIAEATLSDAASMKTIAVLTMVFLPGTAVASFFSMTMFNWTASDRSQVASGWLWIFFVITVPLTCAVLVGWYWWSGRCERAARAKHSVALTGLSNRVAEAGFLDIPSAVAGTMQPYARESSRDDIELAAYRHAGKDEA